MLQVNPKERISIQRLDKEYVRSEKWAAVRDGTAVREGTAYIFIPRILTFNSADDWKPDINAYDKSDEGKCIEFLAFRGYEDLISPEGSDPMEFEYKASGALV